MPANLDFALYFNIVFFSLIGLGFIVGYFRGMKKALWSLIVTFIFFAIFFITIDTAVSMLWNAPLGSLLSQASSFMPGLANANTIGEAVFIALEDSVGSDLGATMSNANFLALITGLAQFVLKIIYTIIYFSVGKVIYTIVMFIFRIIVIGDVNKVKFNRKEMKVMKQQAKERKAEYKLMSRKEKRAYNKLQKKYKRKGLNEEGEKIKKPNKHRLVGALLGAGKGTVSAFMTLIILGGVMNITESMLNLIPDQPDASVVRIEQMYLSNNYNPLDEMASPEPLASPLDLGSDMEEQLDLARASIAAFNSNMYVQTASKLKITDDRYANPVALNLYLFDSVLSFDYGEQNVRIRNEIVTLTNVGAVFLNSDFSESQSINDIHSEDIVDIFDALAASDFIAAMIPLAIEVGSDYADIPVEVPIDELYEIDWKAEISTLGAVVAVGFDLVNTAGLLSDETDLTTVTIEGDDVKELFDSLSESELVTLGAYVAVEPLLEQMGGEISAIITVPEDIDWADEFKAFGLVADAVLDTGISVGELQDGDPSLMISAMSTLDFTVLLNSSIVSHALRNIFDGTAGIEGMEMIVIPTNVVWFDVVDDQGVITTPGELRSILEAVNVITNVADGFEFDNIGLDVISDFDNDTIDTIFDSKVLVATISDFILNMDLGDTPLIIPDTVLDAEGYITSEELKVVATSAKVLLEDLACDAGDTACEETGFDFAKAFSLTDTAIDTLTSSKVLAATLGNLIITSGGDILVIPNSALETISVDSVDQDVVSKAEIKKLFQAVSVLGFTDLENMAFDASIITNLATEADDTVLDTSKSAKLFGSSLVLATLSEMLFEQTEGSELLSVPYFAPDNTPVRVYDAGDDLEYLSTTELDNILQALLTLDITDFSDVTTMDLGLIIANSDDLLESAILHATISQQVFDLEDDTIAIPYQDELGADIRVNVGVVGDSTDTQYILKSEIIAVLDSLEILGLTDITSFSGSVDMASITDEPGNITTMLLSSILQATISKQLLQLDTDETLTIPYFEEDDSTLVRVTVGNPGETTEYIVKTEIQAMVDSLDLLGATDMTSFDGNIDLNTFYDETNRNQLLESSIMQATITEQLTGLGGALVVPTTDVTGTDVRVTVGALIDSTDTEYITKAEIGAMFEALELLGIDDINDFTGDIDISTLSAGADQDTFLSSASIHATVTDKLLDLGGTVLVVPMYTQAGETPGNEVRTTVSGTEFVTKGEIKALIDSFIVMGFSDLESFGAEIDSSSFFSGRDTLLLSSSIQATLSNKMLTGTSGELVVPDTNVNSLAAVRITQTDVVYIDVVEMDAILDSLELLGLTDFTSMSFSPANIFGIDYTELFASASIQATVSKNVLENAADETAPAGTTTLIIPNYFRDDIAVDSVTEKHIEKAELINLLESLDALGVTDFSGGVSATIITDMSDGEIDTFLASGSMHTTVDNMLRGNANINTLIPDLAKTNAQPYENDLVTKVEIKAFIKATKLIASGDISNVSFNLAAIAALTPAERLIVADSMIVRNALTPQLEAVVAADPLNNYVIANSDYMGSDPLTFFTATAVIAIIETYY